MQATTKSNPNVLTPVSPAIENYMRLLVSRTDHPVLTEMEAVAKNNNFPIIGRLVGIFLETLAKTANAQRVFEFGSGYGYSAYWFAKAVGPEGKVICSDGDPLNKEKAEKYLNSADLGDRVSFHIGRAQEIFSKTEGLWHGRVAVENYVDIVPGWTEAIIKHNQLIFDDPEFDAFINPTRDGVIVARRKTT